MNTASSFFDGLLYGDMGTAPTNLVTLALGLVLAFSMGHIIAWVYMLTHSGLSYSRTFVNALLVLPAIVSLVMNVLANNLILAFGMMAVFAIVRFRNILRDTLDTAYILIAIVIGMACGSQKFSTALAGCALLVGAMLYLWLSLFGMRHRYDLIINLHWTRTLEELPDLLATLRRHGRRVVCASQRTHEGYEGTDLSYRLLLRDPDRANLLVAELKETSGVNRVTTMKAEDESEV